MRAPFQLFPAASFCLDIGDARQIDPTMATALMMLTEFSERLVQIHVSEVGKRGDCPVIIESFVAHHETGAELTVARELFNGGAARAIA